MQSHNNMETNFMKAIYFIFRVIFIPLGVAIVFALYYAWIGIANVSLLAIYQDINRLIKPQKAFSTINGESYFFVLEKPYFCDEHDSWMFQIGDYVAYKTMWDAIIRNATYIRCDLKYNGMSIDMTPEMKLVYTKIK